MRRVIPAFAGMTLALFAGAAEVAVDVGHHAAEPGVILLPRADEFSGFSLFISRDNPKVDKSPACAASIGKALRGKDFKPSRYHADAELGESRPFADEVRDCLTEVKVLQ